MQHWDHTDDTLQCDGMERRDGSGRIRGLGDSPGECNPHPGHRGGGGGVRPNGEELVDKQTDSAAEMANLR